MENKLEQQVAVKSMAISCLVDAEKLKGFFKGTLLVNDGIEHDVGISGKTEAVRIHPMPATGLDGPQHEEALLLQSMELCLEAYIVALAKAMLFLPAFVFCDAREVFDIACFIQHRFDDFKAVETGKENIQILHAIRMAWGLNILIQITHTTPIFFIIQYWHKKRQGQKPLS